MPLQHFPHSDDHTFLQFCCQDVSKSHAAAGQWVHRSGSGSRRVQWGNGDSMDSDEQGLAEKWVAADKTSCLDRKNKRCQNTDRQPANAASIGSLQGNFQRLHSSHPTGKAGEGGMAKDGGTTGSDSADTQTADSGKWTVATAGGTAENGTGSALSNTTILPMPMPIAYSEYGSQAIIQQVRHRYEQGDDRQRRCSVHDDGDVWGFAKFQQRLHDTLVAHNSQTWGIAVQRSAATVQAACVKWLQAASAWIHSTRRGVGSNTGNGSMLSFRSDGADGVPHTENMGIGATVNPIQAVAVVRDGVGSGCLIRKVWWVRMLASGGTPDAIYGGGSVLNVATGGPLFASLITPEVVSRSPLHSGKAPFGSGAWQGVRKEQDNFSSAQAVAATGMGHGWQGAERVSSRARGGSPQRGKAAQVLGTSDHKQPPLRRTGGRVQLQGGSNGRAVPAAGWPTSGSGKQAGDGDVGVGSVGT
ncbi:uncharacterized protein EI90DRAFT_3021743 [Cantharellus anzutake]|uniref:uncharacterized protein n=1 Tax=Cantharellus anzutake TaxID=1750568 RepID=UPI0019078BF3|nr:uncharacterized protein EI90DRAFT_3021743 [Cantharellus anzutake]KAF8316004.1 hypothetical protein EI90DRAFT_3021743 [Cantharellus anzutake]